MKKFLTLFLVILSVLIFASCSAQNEKSGVEPSAENSPVKTGVSEFDQLLQQLPLSVVSVKYVIQDDTYKALYPDMLQAVIKNNTPEDIKNAVIAFVAWDENNLPVKIKGNIDFSDGEYIKEVKCSDINLVSGATYGENNGFSVDEKSAIKSFKAIVVSFETFDADTWENPYYRDWCSLYEGVKYSEDMTIELVTKDPGFEAVENSGASLPESTDNNTLTEKELQTFIDEQPLSVVSVKYVIQDDTYKALYPDMLQAVIKNNTPEDIKDAVIAFVAWDENNLPVKIKGNIDFSDGEYIKEVKYSDINLVSGATYGENKGFSVDEKSAIKSLKAIVVSYETFDADTWENPYYRDWCAMYEEKKLSDIKY